MCEVGIKGYRTQEIITERNLYHQLTQQPFIHFIYTLFELKITYMSQLEMQCTLHLKNRNTLYKITVINNHFSL